MLEGSKLLPDSRALRFCYTKLSLLLQSSIGSSPSLSPHFQVATRQGLGLYRTSRRRCIRFWIATSPVHTHPCACFFTAQGSLLNMAHIASCIHPGVDVKRLSNSSYIVPPLLPLPQEDEVSSLPTNQRRAPRATSILFNIITSTPTCCWTNSQLTTLLDRQHTKTERLGPGGWLNRRRRNINSSQGNTNPLPRQ